MSVSTPGVQAGAHLRVGTGPRRVRPDYLRLQPGAAVSGPLVADLRPRPTWWPALPDPEQAPAWRTRAELQRAPAPQDAPDGVAEYVQPARPAPQADHPRQEEGPC